jgi:hypothetical protein
MARDPDPDDGRAVEAQLDDRGYDLIHERRDDAAFGDTEMIFQRGATLVRLVRDRGQWFVDATASAWEDWFAPTIWRALLTDSMPALGAADLAVQGRMMFDDLDRIEAAASDASPRELEKLRHWRARRAEARRALPPDRWPAG